MDIPLNVLHNFIGAPIFGWLAFDTFRRNRSKSNQTALYFGWASFFASIALFFFSYPTLFTHDTYLLSVGVLIGDCFFAGAMLMLWLIYIRVFLPNKPLFRTTATILIGILTLVIFAEAVHRTLTPPYGAYINYANDGIALVFRENTLYKILVGLDSLALVFTGVYFWRLGKQAPNLWQRMRVRGLAIGFGVFATSLLIVPALPLADQATTSFGIFLVGVIIVAITSITGAVLQRRSESAE
ncbi:hypothetical protein EKI60_00905 [Candidatus Saccharibacteria bacterium]|nr:MAG: hypothetical protein EKI60_00905 [Candidatus Saccharibacteria bacterium]